MAFIGTSLFVHHQSGLAEHRQPSVNSLRDTPRCTAQPTRRAALRLLVAAAGSLALTVLPALSADNRPGLPAGAREFSRLLSARRQWGELRGLFASNRELEDGEWDSLRGYLRTIYQTSADMDYLAKPWDKALRERGNEVIKRFRATVKGMEKPAIDKDVGTFADMHAQAAREFDAFFSLLKEASVGDIPDEL